VSILPHPNLIEISQWTQKLRKISQVSASVHYREIL